MDDDDKRIQISKLDAAHRQLETALALWFNDNDPVSIHTLAYAAYEIVHAVSKKRNPYRKDLLFDSDLIDDQYRAEFNSFIKKDANFFKHANRDGESVIDFAPISSELFILFACLGLEICGERKSEAELAYFWWVLLHRPTWLTQKGGALVSEKIPVDQIANLKALSKKNFFHAVKVAIRSRRK